MGERRADGGNDLCIWSSPAGGNSLPIGKQIFCNRSLNMKSIVAVGFDMDYTLAQYKPETFEALAYEGTVKKLVDDLGYPSEVGQELFYYFYFCNEEFTDALTMEVLFHKVRSWRSYKM